MMHMTAEISDDGVYRFDLTRSWAEGRAPRWVCFCGLNPSTADATVDDPTIRREIGFAKAIGATGLVKVNLVPYRATDPKKMLANWNPVEDVEPWARNLGALELARDLARGGDGLGVFAAWGNLPDKALAFEERAAVFVLGQPLLCLGTTKSGSPRHPLYMPRNACPVEWTGR